MSKKPVKKKQPEVIEKIEAKHEFTSEEKIGLLDNLSQAHHDVASLKDQAKHSAANWKNRIKEVENRISDLSNKATSGYELRLTECRVEFNAKKGVKTYINRQTKEEVETREMTASDYELPLFNENGKNPPKPGENLNPVGEAFPAEEQNEG